MASVGRQSWMRDFLRRAGCTIERVEGLRHSYLAVADGQRPHLMLAEWARGDGIQEAVAALALCDLYRERLGEDPLLVALTRLLDDDLEELRAALYGSPRACA